MIIFIFFVSLQWFLLNLPINMKKLFKEYWLTIITLLLLAIAAFCSTSNSLFVSNNGLKTPQFTKVDSHNDIINNSQSLHDIDIPDPLKDVSEQILYRKNYIVSYNKDTKIPNWVAWHLTAEHISGNSKRLGNAFHEDTEVPYPRATNQDYKGSGWSRGHMCPAGDNKWNSDAMYESFLLSNVCPQNQNLNSGVWNQIEMSCRKWAQKYGDIYIITGPILLNKTHETIGTSNIVVPDAFFKVVVCLSGEAKGIGFICRNTNGSRKKDNYVNSISQIERVTRINFFPHLAPDLAAKIKSQDNLSAW